jgi:OOP family OmpA-OmpF porin
VYYSSVISLRRYRRTKLTTPTNYIFYFYSGVDMKNRFSTTRATLFAGLLISSGIAFGHNAGEPGTATEGHLRDSNNHPVKNSQGECWHLGAIQPAPKCIVEPEAPAPAPVAAPAPTPAPAPAPAPAAPAPVKHKVTLQGDALFDFNKSTLKPKDIAELNETIDKVRKDGITTVSITATGHTDNVGTDAYNDKLSLRRAQAVKDYLVSKGVDANKISVEGKGERQPVASNKTKEGRAKNRRVDIEYDGVETVVPKK